MSILCPACNARIAEDSRSCPNCAAPLEPARPTAIQRTTVMFSRLLILLALVVNIIGWVVCLKDIDTAVMLGLLDGLLGFILFIIGLIARYRWAWVIGLAHFALPQAMFGLVALFNMGPLQARPAFLRADAVFLVIVVPLSIIGCYRGPASRAFKRPGICCKCGYPLSALTEPRCPECGTPFDPKLLGGRLSPPQGPATGA